MIPEPLLSDFLNTSKSGGFFKKTFVKVVEPINHTASPNFCGNVITFPPSIRAAKVSLGTRERKHDDGRPTDRPTKDHSRAEKHLSKGGSKSSEVMMPG